MRNQVFTTGLPCRTTFNCSRCVCSCGCCSYWTALDPRSLEEMHAWPWLVCLSLSSLLSLCPCPLSRVASSRFDRGHGQQPTQRSQTAHDWATDCQWRGRPPRTPQTHRASLGGACALFPSSSSLLSVFCPLPLVQSLPQQPQQKQQQTSDAQPNSTRPDREKRNGRTQAAGRRRCKAHRGREQAAQEGLYNNGASRFVPHPTPSLRQAAARAPDSRAQISQSRRSRHGEGRC
jgi:hypothetical protein